MSEKPKNNIQIIANKFNNIYNIIIFVILVGSGIGNYVVSNYKHDQHFSNYANLEKRIEKTEQINYELLLTQLEDIQAANKKLDEKLNKTNERIDKVLEILSDK